MSAPKITRIPTPVPQRSDMENFDERADVVLTALPEAIDDMNIALGWVEHTAQSVETNKRATQAHVNQAGTILASMQQNGETLLQDATNQASLAKQHKLDAELAAALAESAAGLEPSAGKNAQGMVEDYSWPISTIQKSYAEVDSEKWLPCDGFLYLQSEYPDLFSSMGILPWAMRDFSIEGYIKDQYSGSDFWSYITSAYGNGVLVVRADTASANTALRIFLYSSDLVTWHKSSTNPFQHRYHDSLMFVGGLFFQYGNAQDSFATSSDGDVWASHRITGMEGFRGVAYGNGVYVAVGGSKIGVSSDEGVTWTSYDAPTQGVNDTSATHISFINGKFYLGGSRGSHTSGDGVVWSEKVDYLPRGGMHGGLQAVETAYGMRFVYSMVNRTDVETFIGLSEFGPFLSIGGKSLGNPFFYKGYVYYILPSRYFEVSKDFLNWHKVDISTTNNLHVFVRDNEIMAVERETKGPIRKLIHTYDVDSYFPLPVEGENTYIKAK